MRKQSIFLIFAIMLASCNSLAGTTQSPSPSSMPSPSTTASSTQAPSSGIDATWKTYSNAKVGFSILYPSNWQVQDLPDEVAGTRHHIVFNGPEGGVELLWGTGFGGACPEGYQPIAVAKGTLPACHTHREDGTDLWSLAGQALENTTFAGEVYTNDATVESRAVVLRVISTLSFP
jgi:predicted small secreted protein